jgi:malate synthase
MAESAGIDVTGPAHERFDEVLTPEALDFLAAVHREFDARRQDLLAAQKRRYADLADGGTLDFLPGSSATTRPPPWRRPARTSWSPPTPVA